MRPLLVLALAVTSVAAQSVLDYTKLPDCARQCVVLAQAEGSCVPPAAPVTSQDIYQSCVCQSALLTGLHASGAQCVATGCSADDAAKISTYYNALCNGPVVIPDSTATSTSTSTSTTSTSTATAGAAGTNKTSTSKNKSWWSTHWNWVIFAIVLLVALPAIWVGGFMWKRHHDRKRDLERANVAAHNAPFNPPPSGSERSLPSILKRSSSNLNASSTKVNGAAPTPPMTAMSAVPTGPRSMAMDGGIGGIAPPRGPNKLRSRSSTLQSLGLSNGSKAQLSEPVAWGPHQYQAFHNVNRQSSAIASDPPSPSSAMTPPQHSAFRNREFSASEPRFVPYKPTPTPRSVESLNNYSTPPTSPSHNRTSATTGTEIERPRTAGSVSKGNKSTSISPTPL